MSKPHPFLEPSFLVPWSRLTPDRVEPDILEALRRAREKVGQIALEDLESLTFENTFLALEEATEELDEAWRKVDCLGDLAETPELRRARGRMLPKVTEFYTGVFLNEPLWSRLKTFADNPENQAALTPYQRRLVEETRSLFIRGGADLTSDRKRRLQEIKVLLAEKTRKFSENVLDATNDFELILRDKSQLAGLPETACQAAFEDARAKGIARQDAPAWRFTLHAPSYLPVIRYLDDERIRKKIWRAATSLCSRPPHDNTDLIWEILQLRQEMASLLGYADFSDFAADRRMAGNGARAIAFVEDLRRRMESGFIQAQNRLIAFRARETDQEETLLHPWEIPYWLEKLRKKKRRFDQEELRPYFPIEQTIHGLFELAEELFGIRILRRLAAKIDPGEEKPAEDWAEIWHPDVRFYDVFNARNDHIGSFFADWHPRETKRSGAWMTCLKAGRADPDGQVAPVPHLGLISANLTKPLETEPSLLTHDEALTIFHEFGHLLHLLLGRVPIKSLNGLNAPWDFVEFPSQIMENFCWEKKSLDRFARHYKTGMPIPDNLHERLLDSRSHMAALGGMRQLSYAILDLRLHQQYGDSAEERADLDSLFEQITRPYRPKTASPVPNVLHSFSHLFASPVGYAAGYYSYKWSEVLEADAFTAFQSDGIVSREVAGRLRRAILSRGNSAPPETLFHDFMGREPDPEALMRRYGFPP